MKTEKIKDHLRKGAVIRRGVIHLQTGLSEPIADQQVEKLRMEGFIAAVKDADIGTYAIKEHS